MAKKTKFSKRTFLLLAVMFVTAHVSYGKTSCDSDTVSALHIYMADSTHITYSLYKYPVISFVHDSLRIETAEQVSYFWHGDILLYTFDGQNQDTNVNNIEDVVESQLPFRLQNEIITIFNPSRDVVFSLYTIDGKVLQRKRIPAGNNYTVSLQGYPTSVYLLQINGITYKIIKP